MKSESDPEVTDFSVIDGVLEKPIQKEALEAILKDRLERSAAGAPFSFFFP
jgi:hypothetical protein